MFFCPWWIEITTPGSKDNRPAPIWLFLICWAVYSFRRGPYVNMDQGKTNIFCSMFLGGALDPLGEFVRPPGPTLEKTIFYNFLKICFFGYKWFFFQSCAILVWTMRFSISYSIYEHIFTTGFRHFHIRCHSGTLRSHL